jgi:hypothetical protein
VFEVTDAEDEVMFHLLQKTSRAQGGSENITIGFTIIQVQLIYQYITIGFTIIQCKKVLIKKNYKTEQNNVSTVSIHHLLYWNYKEIGCYC